MENADKLLLGASNMLAKKAINLIMTDTKPCPALSTQIQLCMNRMNFWTRKLDC